MTVTPFLQKVPYDPVNDFRQIMQYGSFNLGLTLLRTRLSRAWPILWLRPGAARRS